MKIWQLIILAVKLTDQFLIRFVSKI